MSEKNYSTADIQAVANGIRKQILGVALKTGGCYLAQACSSAEIIASLYTRVMNLGPSVGSWEPIPFPGVPGPDNMDYQRGSSYNGAPAPDKDRFFVSCCHYASVIYAALAETGRISPDCMDKFNVDGWNMEMIGAEHSPGFENTAGSLGQTISIAGGTAHAMLDAEHDDGVAAALAPQLAMVGEAQQALRLSQSAPNPEGELQRGVAARAARALEYLVAEGGVHAAGADGLRARAAVRLEQLGQVVGKVALLGVQLVEVAFGARRVEQDGEQLLGEDLAGAGVIGRRPLRACACACGACRPDLRQARRHQGRTSSHLSCRRPLAAPGHRHGTAPL